MRAAIVLSAGFHELGAEGEQREAELSSIARNTGMRLVGPSSMGVASPRPDAHLQAALVDVELPVGGVAVSMQSGSLGGSLLRRAADLQSAQVHGCRAVVEDLDELEIAAALGVVHHLGERELGDRGRDRGVPDVDP